MMRDYQKKGRKLLFVNLMPRICDQLNEANMNLDIRNVDNSDEEINDILFNPSIPLSPSAILLDEMTSKEKDKSMQGSESEQKTLL